MLALRLRGQSAVGSLSVDDAHVAARSGRRHGDTRVSSERAVSLLDIRECSRYPVPSVGDIKKEVPRYRVPSACRLKLTLGSLLQAIRYVQ
jgi:hypothetical protein